jgi:hypothetical protein
MLDGDPDCRTLFSYNASILNLIVEKLELPVSRFFRLNRQFRNAAACNIGSCGLRIFQWTVFDDPRNFGLVAGMRPLRRTTVQVH